MNAEPTIEPAAAGASFYALGPEFEWLASAWDGFARELTAAGGALRHVVEAAAADSQLAAESSGLAALESATDRLVHEIADDASRIRHTQATYEQADAAVHAAVPAVHVDPISAFGVAARVGSGPAAGDSGLWRPAADPQAPSEDLSATALGTLSRVRRQILARAEHWVSQHIPYNQGSWYEGYRTDCSGYVSMCWGLRDSMVTSTMPQIAHPIAKEDLRAGDVLLNTDVASGHVILFDRWADYAHNSYVGFELCPQGTLHHVVPYPYYGGFGVYEPYRYNNTGD